MKPRVNRGIFKGLAILFVASLVYPVVSVSGVSSGSSASERVQAPGFFLGVALQKLCFWKREEVKKDTAVRIRPAARPVVSGQARNEGAEAVQFSRRLEAGGMNSPDGIAIHPKSGLIYVTEEDRAAVSVIRDGKPETVVDAHTPIYRMGKRDVKLRSPEGMCFSPEGDLYVVEDVAGGRIVRFIHKPGGGFSRGEVVPLPGIWSDFSWEDIAVKANGELLLAGSDVESLEHRDELSLPIGVILYRDAQGAWWMPYQRVFSSFSSVVFSKSGTKAVYTCELSGEIGWFDLRKRNLFGGNSSFIAKSPEGLCVLPDGSLLVAEEPGRILHLDPGFDKIETVAEFNDTIESVYWDPIRRCVWVTDDGSGELYRLDPRQALPERDDMLEYAVYHPKYSPRHVPPVCPDYLEPVLAMGGIEFGRGRYSELTFRRFAARVPMIAADVEAVPTTPQNQLLGADELKDQDPIERIQFVVFQPNQLIVDKKGTPSLSLAGFAARTRSGKVIRTSVFPMSALVSKAPIGRFDPAGLSTLVVPQPASVTVSPLGITSVQFLGLGKTPDYALVLNPRNPEDSYMLVVMPSGERHHYRLRFPRDAEQRDRWVIAYENKKHDEWQMIAGPASGLAETEPAAPRTQTPPNERPHGSV